MSDQQRHILYYGGDEYSIIAKKGEDLFTLPRDKRAFAFFCPSNPDGYFCEYELSNNLLLSLKQVNMLYTDEEMQINGVCGKYIEPLEEINLTAQERFLRYMQLQKTPEIELREEYGGCYIFQNINLPIQFSGKLLIGTDFDSDYYVPYIGFQKAWGYSRVYQLEFKNGNVVNRQDMSEVVQILRKMYKDISKEKDGAIIQNKLVEWNRIIGNNDFIRSWEYAEKHGLWSL